MSEEVRALEAAIDVAPDDPRRYAVLGDLLQQRGDPRGELISLQLAPELDRRGRERVKALLYEPSIRCLAGPLAQWRWGYVHTATLLRPAGPGEQSGGLEGLLRHASARFLRALTLGREPLGDGLEALARVAPPVLETLGLYSPRPLELSAIPTGLQRLRVLAISAPEVTGTIPPLTTLRALELSYVHWDAASAARLFSSNLQRLDAIKLACVHEPERGCLEAVLALPSLRHLTLETSGLDTDAIAAIAESPARERLVSLDLSRSGLSERAAKRLLHLSREMPALSELRLGDAVD